MSSIPSEHPGPPANTPDRTSIVWSWIRLILIHALLWLAIPLILTFVFRVPGSLSFLLVCALAAVTGIAMVVTSLFGLVLLAVQGGLWLLVCESFIGNPSIPDWAVWIGVVSPMAISALAWRLFFGS
jgi:hypothetical protein